jgi:6-phosphogluconate dehydrogenase
MAGLGLIGGEDSARLVSEHGLEAVVCRPETGGPPEGSPAERMAPYAALATALEPPRIVLLAMPAGAAVDHTLDRAYLALEPGDVLVDLTPSWWCDSLRRYRRMRHRALYHLDAAEVGPPGARRLLVAGDPDGVGLAAPVLDRLAPGGAALRAGGPGAAHFAAALDDGLTAMWQQAAGEVRQLLEAYPLEAEPAALAAALGLVPMAADGGRGAWLLDDAMRLEAAIPLLAQAVMLRQAAALEEQRSEPPPPRVGGWVDIDEIL